MQTGKEIIVAISLLTLASKANGGWLDPRFDLAGANRDITSLVPWKGALYAVGFFSRIGGIDAPGLARWDGTNWTALQPGLNASVTSAVATDEALFFTTFRYRLDQPAGLIRWDGASWTNLGLPRGFRAVMELNLWSHGKDIYVDLFPDPSDSGFVPLRALGRWNGDGWSVLARTETIGSGPINSLAIAQDKLSAAGALYVSGSQNRLNLGQLIKTNWSAVGGGIGQGLSVEGIASDGTNLFVHGSFSTVATQPADGFALWNGSEWIVPPSESRNGMKVAALTPNSDEILASEVSSDRFDPTGLQQIVRYSGTNRTVISAGGAPGIQVMRRWNDRIYCSGNFRTVGSVSTENLAAWTGTAWTRVGNGNVQGLTQLATCLAISGSNVYAGGPFQYAGEVAANHVARWDGRRWHPLAAGVDGTIGQMAARENELFVIGNFKPAGQPSVANVAKWDGAKWSGLGSGLDGQLTALTTMRDQVLVARILNLTNFAISSWDGLKWKDVASGNFGYGRIHSIVASGSAVWIGGVFGAIDGTVVNNVARWEDGRWQPLAQGLSGQRESIPNDYPFVQVATLLLDGAKLYAGGSFTNASGVAAMNVAQWDGKRWWALGDGIPGFGSCAFGRCVRPVTSLALFRGKLYAGGGFSLDSQASKGHLARWDDSKWSLVVDGGWMFDRRAEASYAYSPLHVFALASNNDELYVAGNFSQIGKVPTYGFAVWHDSDPPSLQINAKPDRVLITWPRKAESWTIEFSSSLGPTSRWKPVSELSGSSISYSADTIELNIPLNWQQQFFRLRL